MIHWTWTLWMLPWSFWLIMFQPFHKIFSIPTPIIFLTKKIKNTLVEIFYCLFLKLEQEQMFLNNLYFDVMYKCMTFDHILNKSSLFCLIRFHVIYMAFATPTPILEKTQRCKKIHLLILKPSLLYKHKNYSTVEGTLIQL